MMKPESTFPTAATCTEADVYAIRALHEGKANEAQQKRAIRWIIHEAANCGALSYQFGSPDATAFNEGRRFVGLQIVRMLSSDVTKAINRRKKETSQAGDNT